MINKQASTSPETFNQHFTELDYADNEKFKIRKKTLKFEEKPRLL